MDDGTALWIAVGSLVASLVGVAYTIWNGRRVHRVTLPIVDVTYSLRATDTSLYPAWTYAKSRMILRNTGKGTARYIRFDGLCAKFPQLTMRGLTTPDDPSYRTGRWNSVTYTEQVDALDPGESIEIEVGELKDQTELLMVVIFNDVLDRTHYTVTRFSFDGMTGDWAHFGTARTFSSLWTLRRGLSRWVGKKATHGHMANME